MASAPPPTPPGGGPNRVDDVIREAKEAARAAGVDSHADGDFSYHDRLARREGAALTTFAFHLDGLTSAVHAGQLERALRSMPGVDATVVYSSRMAWVTAPDTMTPDDARATITDAGVESWLTDTSLRRRADRLTISDRRRRMRRHRATHERARMLMERRKREHAPLGPQRRGGVAGTDVLYTARELITKARLIVAVLLGLPVIALQVVEAWQFPYWQWVSLALATPVVTWCAWPFHRATIAGLRRGMSALDAASSVAILGGYAYSVWVLLNDGWHNGTGAPGWTSRPVLMAMDYADVVAGSLFLDVACGATVLLLFGRLLSRRSQLRSRGLLSSLRVPSTVQVTVVRNDRAGKPVKSEIATAEIRVGDDIIVHSGGLVPSDGVVVGGKTTVDMGPVGGLTRTTEVTVDDRIYAGARVLGGAVKIRVSRTGSRTRLAAMGRWIGNADREENRLAQLATRTASILVPWAFVVAGVDLLMWILVTGNIQAAFASSLSVLACVAPVALALSTTLGLRLGLARAAANGTLLRDTSTIHKLAVVDSIIFNRVGTLTSGPMRVVNLTAAAGENPELVLRVAGALSLESDHAVSRAIVRADREARDAGTGGDSVPHWLDVDTVTVTDRGSFTGVVDIPVTDPRTGEVETRHTEASLWRPRDVSELRDFRMVSAAVSGGTPLVVSWKGRVRGVINVADFPKPDAADAVDRLEDMDIETFMLTRDTYPVARKVADSLGISTVLAGIAPNRKQATVRGVHAQGANVAMVGDKDVLDCLTVADVGILMGSADRIDNAEADVVLIREDITAIPEAVNLTRHVRATVDWNIWLAWLYNLGAIVLAVSGVLHPLLATVLMLGSSSLIEWRSSRILSRDYSRSQMGEAAGLRRVGIRVREWAGRNLTVGEEA
ncbi:heavy metal translocating P-type ATPase [Corynebacterium bovis]|uniref:heavy metal translocating P-type ATPase n=1 Tax=Corynebacterium bovis TaxID=36808 RepID=UPI0021AB3652|nr:heavy metal translocating P-type ATPase [Corynebacterium bovis]